MPSGSSFVPTVCSGIEIAAIRATKASIGTSYRLPRTGMFRLPSARGFWMPAPTKNQFARELATGATEGQLWAPNPDYFPAYRG